MEKFRVQKIYGAWDVDGKLTPTEWLPPLSSNKELSHFIKTIST